MMGDSFQADAAPVLRVKALGTGAIQSVEIVKDGKFIYKMDPHGQNAEFEYTDTTPVSAQSWYYVRIIQTDRNMAWSSPIWVTH